MGDTGGYASQCREALGHLQLAADAFERFDVAQGDAAPHAPPLFANHLGADSDALRALRTFESDLGVFDGFDLIASTRSTSCKGGRREKFRSHVCLRSSSGGLPEIFRRMG